MGRLDIEPEILNVATNEIPYQALSASKAESLLGWRAEYDIDTGLKETIEWYGSFLQDEAQIRPAVLA
jgi:CDP-glucose 4,6-dehydratase